MTKRRVAAAVVLPTAVVGLALAQTWFTGTGSDPVLGRASAAVTGAQAAPAATALLLVVGAALVALLTGGPRVRVVASLLVSLAGVGLAAVVAATLGSGAELVGRRLGELAGRSGSLVTADLVVRPWPYVALGGALLLGAAGVLAAVAARRWSGLSARFERPAGAGDTRGARRSDWDELSEGHDPTRGQDPEPT